MTTPSKVTSPRRTRKTKSVAHNVIRPINYISPADRENDRIEEAAYRYWDEVRNIDRWKCPVIPFPVGGKRGVQIAKEA